LGNQVPETVALARSARRLGAAAASAFGAGFGGAVWALVRTAAADDFLERWGREYLAAFPDRGKQAQFFLTRPGPGMERLD
jgi:galactokinase